MPRKLTSPSAGDTIVDKVKVYEGGLGVTSTAEVVTLLNAIPLTDINVANGVAGLNSSGTIDGSLVPSDSIGTVSIIGPTSVIMQGTHRYIISNYDMFSSYTVTAVSGTVQRDGASIIYTPPLTVIPAGFVINGKTYSITLVTSRPNKPVLAGTHGVGSGNTAAAMLNTSSFSMTYGTRTHLNTDWQIAIDSNFATVTLSLSNSAVAKTGWIKDGLALNTTYYVRVRHRDDLNNVSDWSDTLSFTTSASYGTNEQAKLLASNRAATSGFGASAALDDNGIRAILGSPLTTSNQGTAYVFTRTGMSWSQEKIAVASDPTNGSYFGSKVAIDTDATRMVVAAYNKTGTYAGQGAVYVFLRTGTAWAQEQKIIEASPLAINEFFGTDVAMDSTGTRIAVGEPGRSSNTGRVCVYLRTGVTWALETNIAALDAKVSSKFGQTVVMSPDGTRLYIGAPNDNGEGAVYVFNRSGTTWTETAKIDSPGTSSGYFSTAICVSSDGTRLAISDTDQDHPTHSQSRGTVIFYKLVADQWVLVNRIFNTQNSYSGHFGTRLSCNSDMSKIVVGAPEMYYTGVSFSGRAYQFTRTGDNWYPSSALKASDSVSQLVVNFSEGLAMARTSGQTLIGDKADDAGAVTDGGSAYFFS
jgi:hypothetical protein